MLTLGLNIIAGANDVQILRRCLSSFDVGNVFDEVVIVNTSENQAIEVVAEEFKAKTIRFDWETEDFPSGNFGGARDCARKNSTTDKIMWLDSDDALLPQHRKSFIENLDMVKKKEYSNVMVWRMPYSLVYQSNGTPDMFFMRERIFDREHIEWRGAVHEMTFPVIQMVKHADIHNTFITHMPVKPQYASASRNIEILEHEYGKDPENIQTKYFLGRDYLLSGNDDKGICLLEDILSDLKTGTEMLYAIAIELAWYYSYGSQTPRPNLLKYKKENSLKVQSYCRLALAFTFDFADPYVLIGDVYFYNGDIGSATRMYLTALKKNKNKSIFKMVTMCGEVPCDRLTVAYNARGLLGMAIHYNQQALKHNNLTEYFEKRKKLINLLIEETHAICKD